MVMMDDAVKNAKHCRAAAMHTDLFSRVVVEDKCADPISLMEDPPCGQSGDFCCNDRLHRDAAAEKHVDALVHQKHRRTVSFFRIDTHIRLLHAGGHAPANAATVVPG